MALLLGEREGVGLRDGVGLPERVGEGEALGAASLYSVPPSSATTISLLLDRLGEPRTPRARGTLHCRAPALLTERSLPAAPPPTLVPTTSPLKQ